MNTIKPASPVADQPEQSLFKSLNLLDILMLGAVILSWGVAFVAIKAIVQDAPPFKAAGIRFLMAAAPMLLIAWRSGRMQQLQKSDYLKFAVLGLFQTSLMFGIMFVAIRYVPAGVSSVLLNTNPFFVAVLAHFVIPGDQLTKSKIAGLLLGFSGVVTLVVSKGFGEVALYWPLLVLLAAFFWGLSSILVKKFELQDMVSATAWQSLFGSVPLLVLGFGFESEPVHFTWSFILWMLYISFIASSFAWWAWYRLLRRYSASRISVFLFLIPVCGVLSGVVLLGESVTGNMLIGGALVAAGIIVVNRNWSGATKKRVTLAPALPDEPVRPTVSGKPTAG